MTKVSIIGMGYWGSKIYNAIKDDVEIVKPETSDWVVISTPNDLHFEQVSYWLDKGKNVFCEKPLCLDYKSAESLYDKAFDNNLKLYVDDIFIWRNEFYNVSDFKWSKENNLNYLERLAYHHFYLWVRNKKIVVDEVIKTSEYSFIIKLQNDMSATFDYNSSEFTIHRIGDKDVLPRPDNPLKKMLLAVFSGNTYKYFNRDVTLNATYLLEKVRKVMYPKALVIGGGIFGSTAAVSLSNNGYQVELHEKQKDIMRCASSINQYRLHKGYHYPRSIETATECIKGLKTFKRKYKQSVLNGDIEHYYCIASEDSLVTSEEYLSFLNKCNLDYEIVDSIKNTSLTIKVKEELFDSQVLQSLVKKKLSSNNVKVITNHKSTINDINNFDVVVSATYSNTNEYLDNKTQYQFELCEKPVVKLPIEYKNKSIVIMDGPFMCLDPYGTTDYHVLGNVVHAIHETNIGVKPIIKNELLKEYINNGIIKNPLVTNIDKFINTGKKFFDKFEELEHIGSMYTIRTVLKDREHDDARPTLVGKDNKIYTLFSGKIDTCVDSSNHLIDTIIKDRS